MRTNRERLLDIVLVRNSRVISVLSNQLRDDEGNDALKEWA